MELTVATIIVLLIVLIAIYFGYRYSKTNKDDKGTVPPPPVNQGINKGKPGPPPPKESFRPQQEWENFDARENFAPEKEDDREFDPTRAMWASNYGLENWS